MDKIKVLFICVHNSARSQMAEAFLNNIAGDRFEACSAGLEPGTLNPLAVDAMKELGIDISRKKTTSVFERYKNGESFDYVVTVCDQGTQNCPVFPDAKETLHWSFDDPFSFTGSTEEKMQQTRKVRDAIKTSVEKFISRYK